MHYYLIVETDITQHRYLQKIESELDMSFIDYIQEYIEEGNTNSQNLGLEIEHFAVDDKGNQIGFNEVTALIEEIADKINADVLVQDGHSVGYINDDYAITLEPSCQIEISIKPISDLSKIRQIYDEFLALWVEPLRERGYELITKGNLPLVESGEITPDEIPLSDKKRYHYMDRYFRDTGRYGRYMMRASASTQVSVDYNSEKDLVLKLRVLQKISPILMMMMESKSYPNSTMKDASDAPHLLRIQQWDDIDPDRTGFFPVSFDDDFGYRSIATTLYNTPLILVTDEGDTRYVGNKSAADLFADGTIKEEELDDDRRRDLIEHFMSMEFFHFRIKKYIEIRIADSVPIDKALGYVALLKGLVYSEDNLKAIDENLGDVNSIDLINEAIRSIEHDGVDAKIYHNKSVKFWADYLVDLANNSLSESDKEYLANV